MTGIRIVVVNWNAGAQLSECIASIAGIAKDNFLLEQVVVVDNGSTDGSIESISDSGLPLHIIRNQENRGFAAACNQGAADAQTDFLLFLNPDTRLFHDSLSIPLEFLRSQDACCCGICGIQLVDEDGGTHRHSTRFPSARDFCTKALGFDRLFPRLFPSYVLSSWPHEETRQVDHVIGAFYLVRKSLFERLGGFDERFFVYLEDLDFSFRARQAGSACVYLAAARAFHKGGGTSEKVKSLRLLYSTRSRILYSFKHFSPVQAWTVTLVTLFLEPFSRLTFALARCSISQALETIQGYAYLFRDMPNLLHLVALKHVARTEVECSEHQGIDDPDSAAITRKRHL